MPLSVGEVYIRRNLILCTTKWQMSLDTTKEKEKKKSWRSWLADQNHPSFPACLSLGWLLKVWCWCRLEAGSPVLCIGERLISDCGCCRVTLSLLLSIHSKPVCCGFQFWYLGAATSAPNCRACLGSLVLTWFILQSWKVELSNSNCLGTSPPGWEMSYSVLCCAKWRIEEFEPSFVMKALLPVVLAMPLSDFALWFKNNDPRRMLSVLMNSYLTSMFKFTNRMLSVDCWLIWWCLFPWFLNWF